MKKITSLQNEEIKKIIKLKKARERAKLNLIIIEGKKELSLARIGGMKIEKIYFCPDYAGKMKFSEKEELIELEKNIFDKISFRENPDGVIALASPRRLSLENIDLSANPLLVILENIEKPGNLGAILRSADAARADAVIVCGDKCDIYNPNVIRASLGTVFTNQVATCSTSEVIEWLKEKEIKIFAAFPGADKIYTKADYDSPSAIVVGTEHEGLSNIWAREFTEKIKIPMLGKIDSLNASVSTAVILFEALRQRAQKQGKSE
ncbi:MAG: TrmH family RNA methyltransferase [bacterium]